VEAGQLIAARTRALVAVLLVLSVACAGKPAVVKPRVRPVVLPDKCRQGPFCVTGQLDDQFGDPVAGVACIVLGPRGEAISVVSDGRGFFMSDGLSQAPSRIRFEKTGFGSQLETVPRKEAGAAGKLRITLRRLSDSDCTCEPNELVSGRTQCPDEQCR